MLMGDEVYIPWAPADPAAVVPQAKVTPMSQSIEDEDLLDYLYRSDLLWCVLLFVFFGLLFVFCNNVYFLFLLVRSVGSSHALELMSLAYDLFFIN
jgi:hypothetical protein